MRDSDSAWATPDRRILGTDMPTLVWRADADDRTPAVVTVHGGQQSKEIVGPATVHRVVSAGVTLVAVDLYLHGDHFDTAASSLDISYETLLEIVAHTARELEYLFADLQTDGRIRSDSIAVRGESLGAYVALSALGLGVPFCAALSIAGAADFESTMTYALRQSGASDDEIASEQTRLRERIRAFDPLWRTEQIAPRPVMMIHGAADDAVPIEAHHALYRKLAPLYTASPADCVFLTHAGGHATPAAVDDAGWAWLLQRLVTPTSD